MKYSGYLIILVVFILASCSPIQQVSEPTSTSTQPPQSSITPTRTATVTATVTPTDTITPTATNTATSTPSPPINVFEEDFTSDVLGWNLTPYNPYGDLKFSYGSDGIYFHNQSRNYVGGRKPANLISIEGDFELEVVFDHRVRLSGLWFSNETVTLRSSDNWYYVLVEQGEALSNWLGAKAHIGVYQPSYKYWGYFEEGSNILPGEIDDYITKENGEIHMHLSFQGNKLSVSVNDSPLITDTNKMYSGKKYFMGFMIGPRDQYTVKAIRVWITNKENFKIVNAAEEAWAEAVPTLEAMLSETPPGIETPTNVQSTTPTPITADSFIRTWVNTDSNTDGLTRIRITENEENLSVESWGRCHPSDCYHGIVTTEFQGTPLIIFRDFGFVLEKLVLRIEGNTLHVVSYEHYVDSSGRPDKIEEYFFH